MRWPTPQISDRSVATITLSPSNAGSVRLGDAVRGNDAVTGFCPGPLKACQGRHCFATGVVGAQTIFLILGKAWQQVEAGEYELALRYGLVARIVLQRSLDDGRP